MQPPPPPSLSLSLSLFLFSESFNKCVKSKTLVAHLREAVEPLNAEGYQHTLLSGGDIPHTGGGRFDDGRYGLTQNQGRVGQAEA